ncbi:MAG: SMI1/KNR4 family protein, partial [Planctomycetales bacterium]|nr:SMI1/KNR4 family protein [Planctomycetales bacterium]
KRPKTSKPQTVADCWKIIADHLKEHDCALAVGIAAARDRLAEQFSIDASTSDASIGWLIESWTIHNGSNQIGLFPTPDDIAYLFMSLDEAADARRMLMEVEATNSPSKPSSWTSRIPVAENTAGDYLVVEFGNGPNGAVSRFSHETTRFRKTGKTFLSLLQCVAVDVATGTLCYDRDSNALR